MAFRWCLPIILLASLPHYAWNAEPEISALRTAAEQGDTKAQCELGLKYQFGSGVPKNEVEAVLWYRKAAEQGFALAQAFLGDMCKEGHGVGKNEAEAVSWYRKAAEQGEAYGQSQLSNSYYEGRGVNKSEIEAVKWCRKAAEQGFAKAQYNLGVMYRKGLGVTKNADEAAHWYRKAAEQGETDAQTTLGIMYGKGMGVAKSDAEAFLWFRRAAEQGDPDAEAFLGDNYAKGMGVAKNYIEAYKWYNIAAVNIDSARMAEAVGHRDEIEKLMAPAQIAEAQQLSAAFVPKKEQTITQTSEKEEANNTAKHATDLKATGSGFAIRDDGYLLTNWHVVESALQLKVKTKEGVFLAKLIMKDEAHDLALLKVDVKFSALPLVGSGSMKLGQTVFTIGFPNVQMQGLEPKLTKGEISGLAGIQDDARFFQISVPLQPGNSGGPLVDMQGNVVGITSAGLDAAKVLKITGSLPQNVNYAVKSSFLLAFLETMPEVSSKLKAPHRGAERKFEDVVQEVEAATVLVIVY